MKRAALTALLLPVLALSVPAAAAAQGADPTRIDLSGYARAEPFYLALDDDAASHEAGRFELQSALGYQPAELLQLSLDLALILESNLTLDGAEQGNHRLLINEAWTALGPVGGVTLLVGKRRLPWGVGFADRPTDLLNPAPNPFEPTLLREGAWLATLRWAWEVWTVEAVWAPTVDEAERGWPDALHPHPDDTTFSGRVSVTAAETDLSALYYRERGRHRAGLTAARYLTDDLAVHGEALVRDDSPFPVPAAPPLLRAMLDHDDTAPSFEALAGVRWSNLDLGVDLTLEYQYFGAGLDRDDFGTLVDLLDAARQLGLAPMPGGTTGGIGSREALTALRRHYATAQARYAPFESDWQLALGARVGLEDGGTIVFPSVERRLGDATTLGAGAFVLLGPDESEVDLVPLSWAGFGRVTAFF